ncbi:MAG TPA: molecular chaperone [Thiopseudomonas sp.]|nr:molecular chaperone [Thiopseudomonas sp.]
MDTQIQQLRLQVPTPEQTRLVFCKPNVRDLKSWIQDLPKANIGETARLLYQALIELNNFKTDAENRVQLLELLRPEVLFINSQLEKHFLNNSVMLDERPQKVANLCQALQNHLTVGYKIAIVEALQQKHSVLALALQRAVHSMFISQVRTYQLYFTAPPLFWLELHQIYKIATKNNMQSQLTRDPMLGTISEQSVESAYSCALLLSCARTNQMRQSDIAILANILPNWVLLTKLQNADLPSSLFVADLNHDAPPRYKELLERASSETRVGLNTQDLAEALVRHQQSFGNPSIKHKIAIPDNMSSTLLAQLCSAWDNIAQRDFQRTSSNGTLQVCLGMSAVHYYLSDQEPFEDTLKSHQVSIATYNTDNAERDIWDTASDVKSDAEFNPLQVNLIEYGSLPPLGGAAYKRDTQASAALYPTYTLAIINSSPGGYCLAWHDAVPPQLQAGEIIAICQVENNAWSTALIRWIRQVDTEGTQMGIELIAPNAQPCGLQLLRSNDTSSHFLRALLVPEIPALSQPASVIAPRIPFQEGHKVAINQQGTELKATLAKRSMHTGSISQFEYKVTTPIKPVETQTTEASTVSSPGEDFDSLWKSL